ncbi:MULTISPECIES: SpoIIE family protein phosphatase [Paenibacillus]|uniref:SpoIIE family protein phosphatase n=1 Tax=Paenibacillus radicis (ex Xue et al. 2023) TaxID=2972489 RepID=A0ABT1YT83_9BACL|nr:SpoIIE family protein phosphatase [Paenibacillus radicis (ex Xue et al. 2023)]MCR8636399.1 SpoIIE family protein phosphatase [Paenibacillus radicis (ex Xue et al. 2023)]
MNIVIVDDNPVNLMVIEKIVKSAGYKHCIKLPSAIELLELLKVGTGEGPEVPVDLILLDMMMPVMDGLQACRSIQEDEALRDIPIIIVTAMGDSNLLADAMEAGAVDYVMKPINKVELIARIRVALRLKYEKDWHKENEARIRSELDLAKQVQSSVLSQPLRKERLDISASYHPSFELAGDLYSWYPIDSNRHGIILLDMMGHGISSSLVCMFISSVMQDTITRFVQPETVIAELNRYMNQLNRNASVSYYFTAIYLVIDTHHQTIEYVNAGHPPGILMEANKPTILLDQGSCAVGFFEQMDIVKGVLSYENDMRLFLYTDGLLEAIEKEDEDEVETLVKSIEACEPRELVDIMNVLLPAEIRDQQEDDICMVMLRAH